MADNTPQNGTATVATDEVATLNGAASSGVHVQRMKGGWGADGDYKDTSLADPYPTQSADVGAKADSAASSDTGTFSLIALIKRALQNWTTLLGKLPAALGRAAESASLPVALANEQVIDQQITGQGSQTVVGQNILLASAGTGWLDCGQYRYACLTIIPTGTVSSGTVVFEGTNDPSGSGVTSLSLLNGTSLTSAPTGTYSATTGNTQVYFGPVLFRYVRARISVVIAGGGSLQAFTTLRMAPLPNVIQQVSGSFGNLSATVVQSTASSLNATVTGTVSLGATTTLAADVGVQYRASVTGGASMVSVMSPATPASATIKGSAGRLIGWQLHNGSAGVRSVKLFNATSPTLGTTAAQFEIDIPAGASVDFDLPGGMNTFSTAITYSVTSAKGLTDNTATGLAANDVSGAFFYA